MEGEIGIGRGVRVEAKCEVRDRVRVGIGIILFDETFEAEWAERFGIIRAGDSPTAHVAEE